MLLELFGKFQTFQKLVHINSDTYTSIAVLYFLAVIS